MNYRGWLAKSDPQETLLCHTANCVRTAMRIIDLLPSNDRWIADHLLLAAATHDLGKAASGFQNVLAGNACDWHEWRHEVLSVVLCSQFAQADESVILAVLFHHKTLPADGICDSKGTLYPEQLPPPLKPYGVWKKMAAEFEDAVHEMPMFWMELQSLVPDAHLPQWPSGICDWRDAQGLRQLDKRWVSRYDQLEIPVDRRKDAAKLRGLLRTVDHLASGHQVPPDQIMWGQVDLAHVPSLRGFQRAAASTKGDMLLRAPTGSGKTEACILWLKNNQQVNSRTFFVLPFTASINAMHQRLETLFPDKVGVLHGRVAHYLNRRFSEDINITDVNKKKNAQHKALELKHAGREMYFPMRVCTPHQLVKYFLRGPGWEQMLSEFENACFVFDEIHAYDPKMIGLILGGMKLIRNMGVRVAFVSATFPSFLERMIKEYLGIDNCVLPDGKDSGDREVLKRIRHKIKIIDTNILDILDDIGNDLNERSVLVVVNHVHSAQTIYKEAKDRFGLNTCDIALLHGAFNGRDRADIENRITGKTPPKLLIATQAVEVSLDISYGCGYFEAAPIDALVQRMGRVNRNGSAEQPATINILTRQISRHQLYDKKLTDETILALANVSNQNQLSETQLVELADQIYGTGYGETEMQAFYEAFHHPDYDQFDERLLSGAHQDWVDNVLERADHTIEVLPICLRTEHDRLVSQGLWLEAAGLLVQMRIGRAIANKESLIISTDPWQISLRYDSFEGLHYDKIHDIESQMF